MRCMSFSRPLTVIILAYAVPAGATSETMESVHCRLSYATAVPCQMTDRVGADELHNLEFVFGNNHVRFTGMAQTGWWSGQLDGQPAMGHELNRGHVVFSTLDLKTTFEWWSEGHEHGTY
jgi:hypothetical protein